MASDKEKVESMYERFPKCPLCKSEEGYQFLGWIDDYVQCRYCGAKWLLHEWLSDKPVMKLVEASRDKERGTVVGHELFGRLYSIDFWQKMKVKRLRVKTIEVEKEAEFPEATEVKEETIPLKPTLTTNQLIVVSVVVIIVILAIVFLPTLLKLATPRVETIIVEIECSGEWQGNIGDLRGSYSVEGYGYKTYTFERKGQDPWIVTALVQKKDWGTYGLTVTIKTKDGKVLESQSTTAEFGVVTVSWSG